MTKNNFITLVSIVATVLSLISRFFETKKQPSCINNITINAREVNITCNIEK